MSFLGDTDLEDDVKGGRGSMTALCYKCSDLRPQVGLKKEG